MAVAGPAERGLVNAGEPCELVSSDDGSHLMFRVNYEDMWRSPGGNKVQATCAIADGYTCEVTFRVSQDTSMTALVFVVHGPSNQAPAAKAGKVIARMALLDKNTSLISVTAGKAMPMPVGPGNKGGYGMAVRRSYLEANCIVDGVLLVLCTVYIVKDTAAAAKLVADTLAHRLSTMSDKQELTDVCFDVEGEMFYAHRLVLAAQSPVFMAELLGSMIESTMPTITIPDMRACTFNYMLQYIYLNQLQLIPSDMDGGSTSSPLSMSNTIELQHLLVAADRYGVDSLKQLCMDTLCAGVTTDTVTSTLELAEQRSYPELKASCLDFLSDTQNFSMAATNDDYYRLIHNHPRLLNDIRNRFKKPRLSPLSNSISASTTIRKSNPNSAVSNTTHGRAVSESSKAVGLKSQENISQGET